MSDYLELLLPPDEETEEDAPELSGRGRFVSGAAPVPEGQSGISASDGPAGESPEDRGQGPAEQLERVRAARERAERRHGTASGSEYGAEEGGGMDVPFRSAPGGALESRATTLSAAVGRLRGTVLRQETVAAAERGTGWTPRPAGTVPDGEDPVRLVDAAFQRDARRYDGTLRML